MGIWVCVWNDLPNQCANSSNLKGQGQWEYRAMGMAQGAWCQKWKGCGRNRFEVHGVGSYHAKGNLFILSIENDITKVSNRETT